MKKYDTIIFDFDGVIGDSFEYVVDVIYKNVKSHTKLKLTKKQIAKEIREVSIFEILKQYKIPKIFVPIIVFKIKKDLSKRVEHTKPFNGIIEQLKNLNESYTLHLLTSNSNSIIKSFLEQNEIKYLFKSVKTSSSFLNKSKSIEKLIKKETLDKNTTLYIGDEIRDIVACQKVGIDIAVVSYGFNSKQLLKEYNPSYLIDSVEEIKKKNKQ